MKLTRPLLGRVEVAAVLNLNPGLQLRQIKKIPPVNGEVLDLFGTEDLGLDAPPDGG